ncbi:MAG: hypothetical protein WBG92_05345 [Thiohalocapsa sp.]
MNAQLPSPGRRRFFGHWAEPVRSDPRISGWTPVAAPVAAPGPGPAAVRYTTGDDAVQCVLWGIWASGPDRVFVVGDDGIVLRWNGLDWTREPSDTGLPLHAVWGNPDGEVIAVGWMGAICHRQDGIWRQVRGGTVDLGSGRYLNRRDNLPLFGVCGDASGRVWAAGDHGRLLRYDGNCWIEQTSGVDTHLRGVLGLADGSLLACGHQGLILQRDGDAWHPMETGTRANLTRLWARAADDVYAIGGRYDPATNQTAGCLLHFDSKAWKQIPARGSVQRLRGIAGDQSSLILVGDAGGIYQLRDGAIEAVSSGVVHDLLDVVLFADHGLAVGDLGTLLRSGLQAYSPVATPNSAATATRVRPSMAGACSPWQRVGSGVTDRVLRSVWGTASDRLFAVGESGTILCGDGTRWESMTAPTDLRLHGVWGTSERNVFACGQDGTILHFDGGAWREIHRLGADRTAVAITGFSPHDVFVVGDEGMVLRFDGCTWQQLPSGTKRALYGIWGLDSTHLLAVGDFGLVLRWNGTDFRAFEAGTDAFLYSVWGDSLSNVHAAGLAGTLARFDGSRWTLEPTRSRADLLALAGKSGGTTLAVGTRGTALSYDSGRWVGEETGSDASLCALWVGPDGDAYAVGDGGIILHRRCGWASVRRQLPCFASFLGTSCRCKRLAIKSSVMRTGWSHGSSSLPGTMVTSATPRPWPVPGVNPSSA